MPLTQNGLDATDIHKAVKLLIKGMVEIKDTTGEFLLRLPDGRVIDTKGWNDWEWTHGVGLYGMLKYHELTGDKESLQIIEAWFKARFDAGGTSKNINTMAVFLTLAYVYEETKNPTYLPWLDAWGEWAYHDLERTPYGGMQHITYLEENHHQLWDDTLMMTVLPLAKIGQVLNRPHYIAEATRQFLVHIKYLFDPVSGLFYHGWCFENGGHNFAKALWARGNSWITIVIPEYLEFLDLPENDPIRLHLLDTFKAQVAALKACQDESGLWCTLLNERPEQGSYLEASATAGFAYGILKAIRKRYIGKEYEAVAVKAIQAVMKNISKEGELLNTSFGTGMGHTLQHYKDIDITPMPYGQAMAMMALGEYLRVYI